jgi:ABC-2 type transport system ATP-binding protein
MCATQLASHVHDRSHSESALVVEHLSKRFGDRTAFDDVSFEVGYGEVFGFLGPNGTGKTTTVRTLGTLIAPNCSMPMRTPTPPTSAHASDSRSCTCW